MTAGLGPTTAAASTNNISVDFNGTTAGNSFAGLAPGFAALYQLNVTVPTGISAANCSGSTTLICPDLDVAGPDSFMQYVLIPIAATSAASETANVKPAMLPKLQRTGKASGSLRNTSAPQHGLLRK